RTLGGAEGGIESSAAVGADPAGGRGDESRGAGGREAALVVEGTGARGGAVGFDEATQANGEPVAGLEGECGHCLDRAGSGRELIVAAVKSEHGRGLRGTDARPHAGAAAEGQAAGGG